MVGMETDPDVFVRSSKAEGSHDHVFAGFSQGQIASDDSFGEFHGQRDGERSNTFLGDLTCIFCLPDSISETIEEACDRLLGRIATLLVPDLKPFVAADAKTIESVDCVMVV